MKTDTFIDKSTWGPGPWQREPDRIQWTDEATGYPCLIKRAPVTGALCGYVGIPPGHPSHGGTAGWGDEKTDHLEVHGGVTYGAECDDDPQLGICHIPEPGTPDHLWWIGFDCAHGWDCSPALEARTGCTFGEPYKDVHFVRAEVLSLARQLKELEHVEEA